MIKIKNKYLQADSRATSAWLSWPCPRDISTKSASDKPFSIAMLYNSGPGSAPEVSKSRTGWEEASSSAIFFSVLSGGVKSLTPKNYILFL